MKTQPILTTPVYTSNLSLYMGQIMYIRLHDGALEVAGACMETVQYPPWWLRAWPIDPGAVVLAYALSEIQS